MFDRVWHVWLENSCQLFSWSTAYTECETVTWHSGDKWRSYVPSSNVSTELEPRQPKIFQTESFATIVNDFSQLTIVANVCGNHGYAYGCSRHQEWWQRKKQWIFTNLGFLERNKCYFWYIMVNIQIKVSLKLHS